MKKIRYGLALLPFLFLGLFSSVTHAVKIRTVYLTPVDVRIEVKESFLEGKAWIKSIDPKSINNVVFQVFDNYGAEILTETVDWKDEFLVADQRWSETQIIVPFFHDFASAKLSGIFELRALVQDENEKILARGSRQFELTYKEPVTKIANLELKTGEMGNAQFKAFYEGQEGKKVQPEVIVRVQPQIDVFEHTSGGTLVFSQKGDLQEIPGSKPQDLNVLFDLPNIPETYVVEVRLLDENGNSITGTLKQRLLIDGDFGEISSFEYGPQRFLEAGEKATFSFRGIARRNKKPAILKLQVDQLFQGEVVHTFEQEKEVITLSDPEFKEEFSFIVAEGGAAEFHVQAQLLRDGYLIEKKTFVTERHLKYDSEVYKAYYGIMSDNLYLYLIGFIVIVLILFFVFKSRTPKVPLQILILSMCLGMWGLAHAEWVNNWNYPEDQWAYNPSSSDGFQMIRFQGSITDDETSQGLFSAWGGVPDQLKVYFYQAGTSNIVETVSFDPLNDAEFTLEEYIFEFALPSSLSDGRYTPQVYLAKGGNDIETDWTGDIKIDKTAPSGLQFSYNPSSWTGDPVEVSIQCGTDLAGCFPSPVAPFDVKGNFSDTYSGVRGFEICDQVGNCSNHSSEQLEIDFYDPEEPALSGVKLIRDGDSVLNGTGAGTLEAHEQFSFSIENPIDPTETEKSMDANACGPAGLPTNDIYLKNDRCATKRLSCALSAIEHGSYNQEAGETGCTFEELPEGNCSPHTFPLCIPFYVE